MTALRRSKLLEWPHSHRIVCDQQRNDFMPLSEHCCRSVCWFKCVASVGR